MMVHQDQEKQGKWTDHIAHYQVVCHIISLVS